MMRSRMVTALRAASGRRIALAAAVVAAAAAPGLAQQYQQGQGRSMRQGETQVGRSYQRQLEQDRYGQQAQFGQQQDRYSQQDWYGQQPDRSGQQDWYGQQQGRSGQQDWYSQQQGRRPMGRQTAFPQQGMRSQFGGESDQWVRIAIDFDDDGNFDSESYIYMADLEQAGAMSDRRREFESMRGSWQGQGRMQPGGMDQFQQRRPQQQQQRFRGQWWDQEQRFQQQQDPWYRTQQGGFRDFQSEPGRMDDTGFQRQWEQDRFQQRRQWQGGQTTDDYYGRSQASGMQTIRGELLNITSVQLRGEREPHLVAVVETETGQTKHVDLGAERQLDRLNLREGDRVTLMGTPGFINNRPVLLVNRIGADGQTITVSRQMGQSQTLPARYRDQEFQQQRFQDQGFQDQGFQNQGFQQMGLEGQNLRCRVIDSWEDRVEHDGEEHTFALVTLERGGEIVVDLGPSDDLDDDLDDLDEGEVIVVRGIEGSIDGRPALLAESISAKDGSARINRDDYNVDLRTRRGIDRYLRNLDR